MRLLVPVDVVVAAALVERQHEPLAGRAQLARRAVEGRQGDALDRRVEPVAGVGVGWRGARILGHELAAVAGAVGPTRRRAGRRRSTPSAPTPTADHVRRVAPARRRSPAGTRRPRRARRWRRARPGRRRSRTPAGTIGSPASVTVSISSSRARAIALSPSAPRSSNSAARSGTWPRGASSIALRSAQVTGSLSRSSRSVDSIVCVAPSVARSMPASRLEDSTGAIRARPSTSPAWRAPTDTRAGPDRRAVGGHGRAVEHLVDEVEPGAAHGEGDRRHDRLGAGDEAETEQSEREQRGAADGDAAASARRWSLPPDHHAERAAR